MYVELHILQNFTPNCLNRDDTNSPKDCVFGGYRRARLSSQCLKRAIRTYFHDGELFPPDNLATRTKRVVREAAKRLVQKHGRDEVKAIAKTVAALRSQGLTSDENHETQYLLFLGEREIQSLVKAVDTHWDAIDTDNEQEDATEDEGKKKGGKKKKSKKSEAPKEVTDAVRNLLDGGRAADLALFGRMLADLPDRNVDAASQVAHAISTNVVSMEMDFFTAVDDLKKREEEDAGAGMLGTVEFNSACYYRYANVHVPQLVKNLYGDVELARKTVGAFISASARAIPTGKQNSFAAHNPPSLVFAVVRNDSPWSLANAFVKPVDGRYGKGDLIEQSVRRLDSEWDMLCAAYGAEGVLSKSALLLHEAVTDGTTSAHDHDTPLKHLETDRVDSLRSLIDDTINTINFDVAKGGTR